MKPSLASLFRRRRRNRELEEEIQAHLTLAARERVERGEDPRASAEAARREFGPRALIQETVRETWGGSALASLAQDARYGLRGMRRNPVFTAVAVASLALGIGANTAIFSLVDTILLRMLPVRDPGRLVELLFQAPRQNAMNAFSWRSYQHYDRDNHVFAGVIAFGFEPFALRGGGLAPDLVRGLWVSGNYFSLLGVQPALGRLITPQDGAPGSPANVAVVSWAYWNSRLRLDSAVIGRTILVNGVPATIIGVTPPEFRGMEPASRFEIWLPLAMEPMLHHPSRTATAAYWLQLAARLKPGVSLAQARAEMAVLFRWTQDDEFQRNNDRTVYDWRAEVRPAGSGLSRVRDLFGKPVLLLMAVVALLLLVACANIAGVLLARGAARRREIAVRVSLGASRGRLLRQALTESLLLAVAGALLGILLAYWGVAVLERLVATNPAGLHLQVRPDLAVLLFTAGVTLLTGLLFGLAPACQAAASAPADPLREMRAAGDTRGRRLLGRALVALQVALSVVLLSAAGLFVGHLARLQRLDLGFRRDHLLLVPLNDANSGLSREQLSRAYEQLLGRLENLPGVRSASICAFYPASGVGAMRPANVEGYQALPGERRFLSEAWVAPRYFESLGIPLLAGRDFSFQDRGRPRVAIVNQTLARYFFRGGNPIGRHILFDGDQQPYEIVGVVGDMKSTDLREPPLRFVYFNMFQSGRAFSQFLLRTSIDPEALAGAVRRTVRESLDTVSIDSMSTMAQHVDAAIVPERLIAMLSGLFGLLGPALAALGLYGLLAYTVARRVGEIGVRMALGATRADISRMIAGEALGMLAAGLLPGLAIAWWGKRFAASLVPGLSARVALPIAVAACAMTAFALAAAYLPARRAMRVDPVEALRYE